MIFNNWKTIVNGFTLWFLIKHLYLLFKGKNIFINHRNTKCAIQNYFMCRLTKSLQIYLQKLNLTRLKYSGN